MIFTKPSFDSAGSLMCGLVAHFSFAAKLRWLGLFFCVLLLPGIVSAQRVNLAKFQTTTASSTFSTDYPARNATDGVANNDSLWISSLTLPHTLQVQLPLAMTVAMPAARSWLISAVVEGDRSSHVAENGTLEPRLMFTAAMS